MIVITATAGDEADLDSTLPRGIRATYRAGDVNLLHGVKLGTDQGEHSAARGTFQEIVLDVQTVHGDVEGSLGESVKRARAGCTGLLRPGHQQDEVEHVTVVQGQTAQSAPRHRTLNRGVGGLQDLGAPFDHDRH